MNWFKNMKIRTKLLSSFLIVAILAGVIGYMGISRIKQIDAADTKLYEKITLPLADMSDMATSFQRIRVNVRDAVLANNETERNKMLARIDELSKIFIDSEKKVELTTLTAEGKAEVANLSKAFDAYMASVPDIKNLLETENTTGALLVMQGQMKLDNDAVLKSLDNIHNQKITLAKQTSDDNTALANSATNFMLILIGLVLLAAISLGFIIAINIQNIIKSVIAQTKALVEAAVTGKLATRAKPEETNEEFREIVVGINNTLDAVIGPLNVAAEYVDRISKGNIPEKITDTYNGDFNEIKNNLNVCIDAVNALVADAGMLATAAIEGKLATRADASKHGGDFAKIVAGVNKTLDAVIGPLNVAAEYVDRISKGNIPEKITDNYNGDFNEIKNNLNVCIDAVNALVTDAGMLATAAIEGKLATRADASKHGGDFAKIVEGVNKTLDAVIGPLNVAAEYVDRISKGNIPEKITDNYNGDFNEIKNNLNVCIDAVNALVADAGMLATAAIEGKLATRADASKHGGDFAKIVEGVNKTLDAVIGPLNVAAEYVDRISKGNIPEKITDNYNGDFNEIKNNLNGCIEAINGLIVEMTKMSSEHELGDIDVKVDVSRFEGAYAKMADGVNLMVGSHIAIKKKAMGVFMEFGNGNFEASMEQLPGKKKFINDTIEQVRANLKALIEDANFLAKAAVEGRLATRADVTRHQGDFRKIVEGVNHTLDSVIGPLNVAAMYVDRIAKGDMPEIITDNYNGDFNNIKNNLNSLIKAFNEIIAKAKMVAEGDLTITLAKRSDNDELMGALSDMVSRLSEIVGQVMEAAQNVATSSGEMSTSAVQISEGASEQSASAEQVSSSIEEMSSSIQQNSDNSVATEKIAVTSAQGMMDVNIAAQKSLEAIRQISEKIKVINDIAGKTDILAINAAIEAARAGEQGKGFAVVAAEVRKLAEVSQKAAVEINELSASSLRVTEESGSLMLKIIPEIQKTAQLVKEIAASSHEQRSGSEQITKAVMQFTQVTQQNAAAAEEMSSSSEELASQAELLKETIGFFNTGKQIKTAQPIKGMQKTTNKIKSNHPPKYPNRSNDQRNGVDLNLESSDKGDNLFENF